LKPGGFCAVNIGDILCFADSDMPKIQAAKPRLALTRADVEAAQAAHPGAERRELAAILGVSEQTVQRRLEHNNVRGGKQAVQTRMKLTGELIERPAYDAGLFIYDRRIWHKDPCWANSQWHTNSYRAVDEAEYVWILWKPGITPIRRDRLAPGEWAEWGSRGVWQIPSVRANDVHEAMFPVELPRRLIRLLTDEGDTILDPFMGSGTSGVAAVATGRAFIGCDKDPAAVDVARRRISDTQNAQGHVLTRSASVRGVNVLWKRSPIQPVPPWAEQCSLCISAKCIAVGGNINAVSSKVSYVNAKLIGPWKVRYRKTVKMQHICRDCREAVRPLQRERRERWRRMQSEMHNTPLCVQTAPAHRQDRSEGPGRSD
jgi:site-specific DNA-methyltransferase (adenine-specific)